MKKKIIFLFVLILSIFSLASCTTDSGLYLKGETIAGSSLDYKYQDSDGEKISSLYEEAAALVDEASDYKAFTKKYYQIVSIVNKAYDAYQKENLTFQLYGEEEHNAKANELYKIILDYFEGMTDEEIEETIGKEKPERYYAIQKEITDIKSEYDLLLVSSDEDKDTKIDKMYIRFVALSNELAKLEGDYSNYLEYAYSSVYQRDYSVTDTDGFFAGVKNYVIPAYSEYNAQMDEIYESSTEEERTNIEIFKKGDCFTNNLELFRQYKKEMGGNFEYAFNHLWRDGGNYFISYEKKGYQGAYQTSFAKTGKPYVFFGPGYHNILTVVHEFGHYYADTIRSVSSYDLAETQSQGNEFLFVSFLEVNNLLSENELKYISLSRTEDAMYYIILASLVNEIEKRVYVKEDLQEGDVDAIVDAIFAEVPALAEIMTPDRIKSYWRRVVIDSAGYYISYATSLVGSLNLYKIATDDFEKGKETYFKLTNFDSSEYDSYRKVYEYAGLLDPFKEETYEYILSK